MATKTTSRHTPISPLVNELIPTNNKHVQSRLNRLKVFPSTEIEIYPTKSVSRLTIFTPTLKTILEEEEGELINITTDKVQTLSYRICNK